MRISDWSSDVCSSDLDFAFPRRQTGQHRITFRATFVALATFVAPPWQAFYSPRPGTGRRPSFASTPAGKSPSTRACPTPCRSEEHTSELQSLMRISYAVFCLKKKKLVKRIYKRPLYIM